MTPRCQYESYTPLVFTARVGDASIHPMTISVPRAAEDTSARLTGSLKSNVSDALASSGETR